MAWMPESLKLKKSNKELKATSKLSNLNKRTLIFDLQQDTKLT